MSNINIASDAIDEEFPIAGINQSSQGFRDNFDYIKTAFTTADQEITYLQSKIINATGDATGTTGAFGTTGAPNTLALTLATVLSTPAAYNTATQDLAITFDAKGRAIVVTPSTITNNVNTSTTYEPSVSSLGTGSGTATFPTFVFDSAGRLKTVGTKNVTYGLLGHTITGGAGARGKLIAGTASAVTAEVPAPGSFAGSYFLVANGVGDTGLAWVELATAGGVVGLVEGPGIDVYGSPSTPSIKLEVSTLSLETVIANGDSIPFYDGTTDFDNRRITFANFKNSLASSFVTEVSDDTSPELGGDLDVGSFEIGSSHANGVVIDSSNGVTIRGSEWPSTVGSIGQVLTTDGAGQLSWESLLVVDVNNIALADYTLVLSDAGDYLRMTNASLATVVVPANGTAAYPVGTQMSIVRAGAGPVRFSTGSGVVVNTAEGLSIRRQFGLVRLTKVATNEWDLTGDVGFTYHADDTTITADNEEFTVDAL